MIEFYTIKNKNKIQNIPSVFIQSMLQDYFFGNTEVISIVPK